MKLRAVFPLAAMCAILLSCNSNKAVEPVDFPQVNLPMYINDQEQAVRYMAINFWDKFFAMPQVGTTAANAVHGVDSISFETAFGTYARLLTMSGNTVADKSVKELFTNLDSLAIRGERKPLLAVMERMEHYFYNPISPVLDEEIYLSALDCILGAKSLTELEKMQYEYQYKICAMNRAGTPAADFQFRELLPSGKFRERSLYDIKGNHTLVFFNNPDCASCAEILEVIKGSPLAGLIQEGKLEVLAMYIDEDLSAWRNNREKYPKEWIYAHDGELILRDNGIYGLRAIPSLYLLDKEKRVILKDAPVEKVISYLVQ